MAEDAKEVSPPSRSFPSGVVADNESSRVHASQEARDKNFVKSSDNTPWTLYTAEQAQDLKRTVVESTDSALRSARDHVNEFTAISSLHFRSIREYVPKIKEQYRVYEDLFFGKLKEGLLIAGEHPATSSAALIGASLLLMRRPRRFLIRNFIWRFQSEEAVFSNAQNKVNEFKQSVELLKNESKKLQERAILAEEELKRGQKKLKDSGNQIQRVVHSIYKTESQAKGLMEILRDIPGREALRLRADVASMADEAKQERRSMLKQVSKITNYGIPV
eukprot:TRINITY_DN4809_c0_g1_i1.p1 TRINITY_DN4809_c0_g1~~TRINITY_DN4809_c0_g1_i1.p1  ORF type:complete len:276 (+),score=58.29 TRINITY_DN4809_c0_g1_i1:86-913(+)